MGNFFPAHTVHSNRKYKIKYSLEKLKFFLKNYVVSNKLFSSYYHYACILDYFGSVLERTTHFICNQFETEWNRCEPRFYEWRRETVAIKLASYYCDRFWNFCNIVTTKTYIQSVLALSISTATTSLCRRSIWIKSR